MITYRSQTIAENDFPNIPLMAASFDTIWREQAVLIIQVARVHNLPALDVRGQILQAIGVLSQVIDNHFNEIAECFEQIDKHLDMIDDHLDTFDDHFDLLNGCVDSI